MRNFKIRNLLLVGLTVLGLSACTNEIDNSIEDANGGLNGYISLAITSPQTRTAPGTDNGVQEGSEEENKVNNVTIVLTDADGNIKKAVPATMSTTAGVTESVEVPAGKFYVYALVNKPTEVQAAGNIQQVVTAAKEIDVTTGFKEGKFFMVNEKHDAATPAAKESEILSTNTKDNPLNVSIKVDRVSVKIVTNDTKPTEITINDIIKDVEMKGYHLLNVNKQFNVIQKWGASNYNGSEAITGEALETPFHNATTGFESQYFHSVSEYTTVTKAGTDITSIEITTEGKTSTPFGNTYVTENRPTIMSYTKDGKKLPTSGKAETTGVIYQVQAKDATGSDLGTFYEYNGLVYLTLGEVGTVMGEDLTGDEIGELRAKGIKVFEEGIMYYTYYIKDTQNNANHKWGGENYNGVFRNSIYNLTVTKLTKIGDDVPGGGIDPDNPNPPIDTDEAYIDVEVTINPWVLNAIDVEF